MSRVVRAAAATAAGYLIGSVPFGVVVGRLQRGVDVREHGSGSMGTTNVLRTVGPKAAAATFLLDVGKGAASAGLARAIGAGSGGEVAAGLAAMVGHSWPVLARFRGGKSVASAFGALIVITPRTVPWALAGGIGSLAATRIVSVGSLSAALSATVVSGVRGARTGDVTPLVFAGAASTIIAIRHRDNIRRLARREEPRVSLSRFRKAPAEALVPPL